MSTRIGIDVGGTFTDLIFYDGATGQTRISKVPSNPANPALACMGAVAEGLSGDQVAASEFFIHSTTVGLNALLQRSGAVLGLLCTKGFRDILEFRRGTRKDQYNLLWSPPPPLVPRYLRLPVTERMRADGQVHAPLEDADVIAAAKVFSAEGVNSVAIAFLHAWCNPEHELRAEAILREAGFEGDISLSHKVSAEYREYERTSTVVVDAFVRPQVSQYLSDLSTRLSTQGFSGQKLVNRSGGGALLFDEAVQRPFETIMSGPVAGVEGAGELARAFGFGDLVTADVGGTSFDTCLVVGGRAPLLFQGDVDGHPIQAPWTDVRSIGAGGGSIAWVDAGGLLQVGPRSAGAAPGPACYGNGGTEPTVTDAAFVLGMLGEGRLASGVSLDRAAANAAIASIAGRLNLSVAETARGIIRIAAASMANAIREITLERGVDPRELQLFSFGGAGPLLAMAIGRELGMKGVIVPPFAGNFSAWGLLSSDLVRTRAKTSVMPVVEEALAAVAGIAEALFAELAAETPAHGGSGPTPVRELAADMRYMGQEHTITVPFDMEDGRLSGSLDSLLERFRTTYEQQYTSTLNDPIEFVTFRATLRSPLAERQAQVQTFAEEVASNGEATCEAWSFARQEAMPFRIVARESLKPGDDVPGPAILTEQTATTYLDAGSVARVDASGSLMIAL